MKKIATFFFAICILNASFVGCKTHKMLSVNEASEMKYVNNSLLLHTPSKTYKLDNYKFSDTMLLGELMKKIKIKGYVIHVHTKQYFYLELDEHTGHYCEIPISNIEKITYSKVSTGKTVMFVAGVWLVTVLILGLTDCFGAEFFTMSGEI